MGLDLRKKHAVITGASRGIGCAVANMLSERGCTISLIGRDKNTLKKISDECSGSKNYIYPYDLSHCDKIEELTTDIIKDSGEVDILINNAGVGLPGMVGDVDINGWHKLITVNLMSLMSLSHFFSRSMKKKGWGAIINIASIAGKLTFPKGAGYCASKHGVVGFSGAMFEDLRDHNIKVCSICPGYVNTSMVAGRGLDPMTMIQVNDIADTVRFVLEMSDYACPTEIVLRPQKTVS